MDLLMREKMRQPNAHFIAASFFEFIAISFEYE